MDRRTKLSTTECVNAEAQLVNCQSPNCKKRAVNITLINKELRMTKILYFKTCHQEMGREGDEFIGHNAMNFSFKASKDLTQ